MSQKPSLWLTLSSAILRTDSEFPCLGTWPPTSGSPHPGTWSPPSGSPGTRTWTPTSRSPHGGTQSPSSIQNQKSHFLLWELTPSKKIRFLLRQKVHQDFPGGSDGKASVYNAGDLGSIPGLGRSPGEGNGNPLQYYCLENPMDRGPWQATVHGVAKSRTRLSDFTFKAERNNGCYINN